MSRDVSRLLSGPSAGRQGQHGPRRQLKADNHASGTASTSTTPATPWRANHRMPRDRFHGLEQGPLGNPCLRGATSLHGNLKEPPRPTHRLLSGCGDKHLRVIAWQERVSTVPAGNKATAVTRPWKFLVMKTAQGSKVNLTKAALRFISTHRNRVGQVNTPTFGCRSRPLL